MPVEYWNPVPIYYSDIGEEQFIKIQNEINEKITNDMYSETEWGDLVKTTLKVSKDILKEKKMIELQSLVFSHITNYFSEIAITSEFYISGSWFNKLPKYGHQNKHTHGKFYEGLVFSGVYFYEKTVNKMEPLIFNMKNEISDIFINYEYVPGRIIIFSGLIPHEVKFNKNEEERKSFTFNVKLV